MTPIDKIKEGILSNDMEQITQGFMLLTGEEVRPEARKPKESNAEKTVQSPVQVRSKDLDFSTTEESSKSEPIRAKKNQFIDDRTESLDIETPDVGRTTRRPPVKMIEVTCHACGEKEMINAQYKSGEFRRCGKCVG
jgi:hypothetical protein